MKRKYIFKHVSITFLKSNFDLLQVFKKMLLVFHHCWLCWRESPVHDGQEASEHQREREMVMAVCSSATGSLRNRENLALNSYLYLGNWKLRAGFILGLRKQTTFRDATTGFPAHDVWETSAEIPYWWRVTTQIWVVLLIGRVAREICFNQSKALPRSG